MEAQLPMLLLWKDGSGSPCHIGMAMHIRAIADKEADVLSLRRKIRWLTGEISRRRLGQPSTKRQYSQTSLIREPWD